MGSGDSGKEYREAYLNQLADHKERSTARQRVEQAIRSPQGEALKNSVKAFEAFLVRSGLRPIIAADRPRLWESARKKADEKYAPTSVEVASSRLALLLGVTRRVARGRLEDAIEAGAVIDVGATDRMRSRTAPKLLAPGPTSGPSAQRTHRGAFPTAATILSSLADAKSAPVK